MFLVLLLTIIAPVASASGVFDVVVLGEVHDNPGHHQEQARRVETLEPKALVFEMLTPEQAAKAVPEIREDAAALGAALGWADSGWPDFALYHPIFAAAPQAQIFGAAIPRATARAAMQSGAGAVFGAEAARFGLNDALPPDTQTAREALQMAAHCDALPEAMLPQMVEIQRLRDAALARAVLAAMAQTGGPVAVITGNGHARKDWGVPQVLAKVAPDLRVFVLGQGEEGTPPEGGFDEVVFAPVPLRDDPCAVFR
ncbi:MULTISPECIES: ChaN family lipoprotein [unclassified Marinovum]